MSEQPNAIPLAKMSDINDGGRAFPKVPDDIRNGSAGMSLLEYYAGQALPSATERALIHAEEAGVTSIAEVLAGISMSSFDIAEAMVAERDRRLATTP